MLNMVYQCSDTVPGASIDACDGDDAVVAVTNALQPVVLPLPFTCCSAVPVCLP